MAARTGDSRAASVEGGRQAIAQRRVALSTGSGRRRILGKAGMSHLSKRLGADSGRDRASGAPRPERGAERPAAERSGAALSTPGMGDRLGVKVPWRKRWC
jgi:hypothetical protein